MSIPIQESSTAGAPDETSDVIRAAKLTKVYKGFRARQNVTALDNLDLTVSRGEIFGLLGPNGSGKTTTVKLLLGLIFQTSGAVTILGAPPTDVKNKHNIGFLPEETNLYKFLNSDETLAFYGRLFNIPGAEIRRRSDYLIELVGIETARKRPLKQYSKGMLRRIGLAQALINDPQLLVLDEPTSGLDPVGMRDMKDLILQMRDEGKTVFMCSHLLADVQDVCDRVAILNNGVLQVTGSVRELISRTDVTEILARKLTSNTLDDIKDLIRERAGEVLSVGHPDTSLEELFIDVVKQGAK